jgi:hypothetical protein
MRVGIRGVAARATRAWRAPWLSPALSSSGPGSPPPRPNSWPCPSPRRSPLPTAPCAPIERPPGLRRRSPRAHARSPPATWPPSARGAPAGAPLRGGTQRRRRRPRRPQRCPAPTAHGAAAPAGGEEGRAWGRAARKKGGERAAVRRRPCRQPGPREREEQGAPRPWARKDRALRIRARAMAGGLTCRYGCQGLPSPSATIRSSFDTSLSCHRRPAPGSAARASASPLPSSMASVMAKRSGTRSSGSPAATGCRGEEGISGSQGGCCAQAVATHGSEGRRSAQP